MVSGDTLTAVARNMQIVAHDQGVAFAAVRSDGSVQTWGCKEDGGDSRAVKLGTSSFIFDNICKTRSERCLQGRVETETDWYVLLHDSSLSTIRPMKLSKFDGKKKILNKVQAKRKEAAKNPAP